MAKATERDEGKYGHCPECAFSAGHAALCSKSPMNLREYVEKHVIGAAVSTSTSKDGEK